MIPFVLMAAGTALQAYGTYKSNMDQAAAELSNAKYYESQASFAREAQFREADIAAKEFESVKGAQLGAFGRGGVDISGSASGVVAQTLADKVTQLVAIKRKGDLEYQLAKSRANQALSTADTLQSPMHNFLQIGGTVLTNTAMAKGAG